ncbi:MAG TPA: ABC transporter ATP-binding protein [Candidatus Saccharimonadales bacterium]|nr:ABC transporter ATP-binding protein [Candidatus Saccharimonadales bacterium]
MENYPAIRAFLSYVGRFKGAFWLTSSVFAMSNLVIATIPWLIGRLAQSLSHHNQHIILWTALLIVASVGHDFLWRGGEVLILKLIIWRNNRFDDVVFEAIVQQPYGYFVDKFTGKISSYANRLGNEYRSLMDSCFESYINLVVAMPVIAATMFTVNIYTGCIFVASVLMMFVLGRKLAQLAAVAERRKTDTESNLHGHIVDAIANFVSIKAYGSERRETRHVHDKRSELIRVAEASWKRDIFFWGGMSLFVRWIIWPATFIVNVYLYVHGHMGLAQMTTFLAAIVLFSNFIWEVIWNVSQLNIKVATIEEAYRYLFGTRNIFTTPLPPAPKALPETAFKQALELRNLSFAYPDKPDVEVLHGINLVIKHGERVGVVGPSGGGKSTLLKLLLGYYPVADGQLLLDNTPIDTRQLTNLTAYVPQDTAMFHRSINDNIAYGKPGASEEAILAAAKAAQAHGFIGELDAGYGTLVGERGIKLSGGQRQRVAIARAILKDAPLLMLDEATSALDSESEQLIQTALWRLMQGRTAIVIAHRLSTIQKMDRILVLDKGTIVEQGTHRQLLDSGGIYAKLWQHQSGGFIEE